MDDMDIIAASIDHARRTMTLDEYRGFLDELREMTETALVFVEEEYAADGGSEMPTPNPEARP